MDREKDRFGKIQPLSRRLTALADMVRPGNVVADVGCDHGFLSIYLVERGIAPRVIATDVRKGPLSAARKHVEERGLSAYIETRLSDGLTGYRPGEAKTLVCAGMGGRLMQRILTENREVTLGFEELILQPQSELWRFRVFLREQGWTVAEENILCEEGKFYFLFRVKTASERGEENTGSADTARMLLLGDKYGAGLLGRRHPVLKDYLEKCLSDQQTVREALLTRRREAGGNPRLDRRLRENEAEIEDLECALALYGEG